MAKCYGCEKETKRKDGNFGNVYKIKKGFLAGSQEVILCSGGNKENGCWYAMEKIFDKGLFKDDDWYELGFNNNSKILTSKAVQTINDNKEFFKNFNQAKAKEDAKEEKRIADIIHRIENLLKEKSKKISISDIAAFIKEDREEVKFLLEFLHEQKRIDFAGNGRYFILSEEKKKPRSKKTSALKSEVKSTDAKTELKKFKEMLDEGLIDQSDYDAKKKELLGL